MNHQQKPLVQDSGLVRLLLLCQKCLDLEFIQMIKHFGFPYCCLHDSPNAEAAMYPCIVTGSKVPLLQRDSLFYF